MRFAAVLGMFEKGVGRVARGTWRWLALLGALGVLPMACGGSATGDPVAGSAGSVNNGVAGQHAGAGAASLQVGGAGGGEASDPSPANDPHKLVCSSPQQDPETGLVKCAEGYEHRPVAVECRGLVGAGGAAAGEGGANGAGPDPYVLPRAPKDQPVLCSDDPSVCDAFQLGYCRQYLLGKACYSGCVTDQDCGAGAICLCDDPDSPTGGRCYRSWCVSDGDCQAGYRCASFGCADLSTCFACQKPEDTCAGDADCKPQNGSPQLCQMQPDGHRACQTVAFR